MATPSFNLNFTEISDCDSTTNWDAGAVDADIKKEGGGALALAIRDDDIVTYTPSSALNMSATDTHIRLWFQYTFPATLDLKANGGIQLWVSDGSNTNRYYVGGSDTHNGAWELLQADLSNPDEDGSANLASITSCGFEVVNATSARNVVNTYWDYFVFGTGYEIYGGTSGDRVTWNDLATSDATNGYGMVQKINGVYFVNGRLGLGDSTGTNDLYFDGSGAVVAFYSAGEKSTLYRVEGTGNGSGVTDILFNSSVVLSAGQRFMFDMDGANVSDFEMGGTKLDHAGDVTYKSGQDITNSVFNDCLEVAPTTATFTGNTLSDYSGSEGALILGGNLSSVSFISAGTGHAIYITSTGAYNVGNCSFSGYAETDGSSGNEVIYNNSGGSVTINASGNTGVISVRNGSGASTNVNDTVSVTISANVSLVGAEIRIYDLDTTPPEYGTELAGVESNATPSYVYAGSGGNVILIQVMLDGYTEFTQQYTMPSVDADLDILLHADSNE